MRAGSDAEVEKIEREALHPRKPANLLYGLDEVPPNGAGLALAVQHVFVMSVGWIFVVVLVTSFGGTPAQSESIIRLSMIASGLATILQARPSPLGSGYLCPFSCGPAYLPASILAGRTGGFPLLWTMTAISGVFEAALSRVMKKLLVLFPPEVTGLVVSMVGIELIALGCPRFLGFQEAEPAIHARSIIVAAITLAAMIAPTIWGRASGAFIRCCSACSPATPREPRSGFSTVPISILSARSRSSASRIAFRGFSTSGFRSCCRF